MLGIAGGASQDLAVEVLSMGEIGRLQDLRAATLNF
jgi:hypothetical protein